MVKTLKSSLIAASLVFCANAASAATFVVEAEEWTDSDALFENIHGGYTGTGYVNTLNEYGADILLFKYIDIEPAPVATIKVRYANGSSANRPADFITLQSTHSLNFPPTGGWNVWREVTFSAPLVWSSNEFWLTATSNSGLANIDKITIVTP